MAQEIEEVLKKIGTATSKSDNLQYALLHTGKKNILIEKDTLPSDEILFPLCDFYGSENEPLAKRLQQMVNEVMDVSSIKYFDGIFLDSSLTMGLSPIDALGVDDVAPLACYQGPVAATSSHSCLLSQNSDFKINDVLEKISETKTHVGVLSDDAPADIKELESDLLGVFQQISSESTIPKESETETFDDSHKYYHEICAVLTQKNGGATRLPKLSLPTQPGACRIVDLELPIEEFEKLRPVMACEFPFELDTFQKRAILLVENHENVLVAAHTSAGKTVVAEYAIAMANKLGRRTIYTSPIKALSNQKFYEFRRKFKDVGIITGDVQINDNAQTLIMTTEILRSLLYHNSGSRLNDILYVIFDEVHYLNDEERGVVWEEILIMLPKRVNLVLLSATIPNCSEVASWIGKIRQKTIHVIGTSKRPVPLEHSLYYGSSHATRDNRVVVVDKDGRFLTKEFYKLVRSLKEKDDRKLKVFKHKFFPSKQIYSALLSHLKQDHKLPCIIFMFSRLKCFMLAEEISHLEFIDKSQKFHIKTFFDRCTSRLSSENLKLDQVTRFRDLCCRGIGVHHSGVLPMLREIVEMLFQRGLLKVLIATETFAIGVNMPAKTVIFSSLEKYSGGGTRHLFSSEYIQMAGRAGRRGQDILGNVYIIIQNSLPSESLFREMTLGRARHVTSKFRLICGSKVDDKKVENVMKSSFSEYVQYSFKQQLNDEIARLENELEQLEMDVSGCELCSKDLLTYCQRCQEYSQLWKGTLSLAVQHKASMSKVFCEGRVVLVCTDSRGALRPAMISGALKMPGSSLNSVKVEKVSMKVLFPLKPSERTCANILKEKDSLPDSLLYLDSFDMDHLSLLAFQEVPITSIFVVTRTKLKINLRYLCQSTNPRHPNTIDLRENSEARKVQAAFSQLLARISEKGNNAFAVDTFKIDTVGKNEDALYHLEQTNSFLCDQLSCLFECTQCPSILSHCEIFQKRFALKKKIETEKAKMSDGGLTLMPEYEQRLNVSFLSSSKVLKDLGAVDEDLNLTLKGRIAIQFRNQFEIVLTELLFDGTFNGISCSHMASVLSCFCQQASNKPESSERDPGVGVLDQVWNKVQRAVERIDVTEKKYGLETNERPIDPLLMKGVCEWSLGCSFDALLKATSMQEGTLIRYMMKLGEICKELEVAAHHLGNLEIKKVAKACTQSIWRDVVNVPSLYIVEQPHHEY